MNVDEDGILVQVQADGSLEGGDSANWMGHWIYLTDGDFPFVDFFEKDWGGYCRHPMPSMTNNGFGAFYQNPWDGVISRDQLTGIIAALISQKKYLAMLRLFFHHAMRGFLFSYNTIHNGVEPKTAGWKFPDLTLFDIWAHELRGFGKFSWILYPLLLVLDLHMLMATLLHRKKYNSDPISYALKLIVSHDHIPTLTSLLSWKLCDKHKLVDEVSNYWSGWRDQGFMVELYSAKLS